MVLWANAPEGGRRERRRAALQVPQRCRPPLLQAAYLISTTTKTNVQNLPGPMAITITAPAPAAPDYACNSSSDSEDDYDPDGDVRMGRPSKGSVADEIVTPGETITEDPQWMR